jgi:hypothetical protein
VKFSSYDQQFVMAWNFSPRPDVPSPDRITPVSRLREDHDPALRAGDYAQGATKQEICMSKSIGRLTGAAALAAAVMAFGVPAKADGVKVGVLSCHESSGWGFIFGSSKGLRCIYHHGGFSERYNGSVSKFGVDIGYTSGAVIIWDVLAPNAGPERGALSGDYVGVQASAAAGPGAGANALIGGFNRSFTLQPVSIQGGKPRRSRRGFLMRPAASEADADPAQAPRPSGR